MQDSAPPLPPCDFFLFVRTTGEVGYLQASFPDPAPGHTPGGATLLLKHSRKMQLSDKQPPELFPGVLRIASFPLYPALCHSEGGSSHHLLQLQLAFEDVKASVLLRIAPHCSPLGLPLVLTAKTLTPSSAPFFFLM
ncbi:hypothetical protein NDU88_005597 [Pleurodeles waltl]|uniref:Uncharacterized protein n=1 Tax=Pleurodeles waltl TaxID=8319 RepID=A0AAV7UII1_PLEWA|nr:hypothetical protein NDU88_005597 [Pleurodeles waltl]